MTLLESLVMQLGHDWRHHKPLFFLECYGALTSIIPSTLTAIFPEHPPMLPIFLMWATGASALVTASYLRHNGWMMLLMAYQAMTAMFGLSKLLFELMV
jgi:hypothetical protein